MIARLRGRAAELLADESGLTTVEYALLLALMVVAALGAWTALTAKTQSSVITAGGAFDQAASAGSGDGVSPTSTLPPSQPSPQ